MHELLDLSRFHSSGRRNFPPVFESYLFNSIHSWTWTTWASHLYSFGQIPGYEVLQMNGSGEDSYIANRMERLKLERGRREKEMRRMRFFIQEVCIRKVPKTSDRSLSGFAASLANFQRNANLTRMCIRVRMPCLVFRKPGAETFECANVWWMAELTFALSTPSRS